jgi:hypothetical protein
MELQMISLMLALLGQPDADVIRMESPRGMSYVRTQIEGGCGRHVLRISYAYNGIRQPRSTIQSISVDGREISGAARVLQSWVTGRVVEDVEMMRCGWKPASPVFSVAIQISPYAAGGTRAIFLWVMQESGAWRITRNDPEAPR